MIRGGPCPERLPSWITFSTTGHSPGDTYTLAIQAPDAPGASGRYRWIFHVRAFLADGKVVDAQIHGTTDFLVRDGRGDSADPYGAGWGIEGVDRLFPINDYAGGGYLWDDGSGNQRYYWRSLTWPASTTDETNWQSFYLPGVEHGLLLFPMDGAKAPEDFGSLIENTDLTFTYTAKDGTKKFFDTWGRLTKVVAPDGQARLYTYGDGDRLATITAPDGGVTTFHYTGGFLSSIDEPGGRTVGFTHDGDGNLTSITDAAGKVRTFTYDATDRLVRDQYGTLDTSFAYDPGSGALSLVDQGLGTAYQIKSVAQALMASPAPSPDGVEATITDGLTHTTHYKLDDEGRLLSRKNPAGDVEAWTYDDHGMVTSFTDALGQKTTYVYDDTPTGLSADRSRAVGNDDLIEVDYPDGSVVHYTHDPVTHEILSETDALGNVTRYYVDPRTRHLVATVDAEGDVTDSTWADGLVVGETGPHAATDTANHTETFQYDAARRLTRVTDPAGKSTVTTYDAAGNVATVTDPMNRVTTTVFDALNRLTSATEPAADSKSAPRPTTTEYDAAGHVTKVTDPRGIITSTAYDRRGLVTSVTVADGTDDAATTWFTYDAAGNLKTEVDPDLVETDYAYDADDRLSSVTVGVGKAHPRQSRTQYDLAGRVTDTYDPLNRRTHTTYDAMGRVLTVTEAFGTTVAAITINAYDDDGRLISVTAPNGVVTTTGYDHAGRVVSTTVAATSAHPRVTSLAYDARGDVASVTGPGGRTTFEYDADDRVVSETDDADSAHPRTVLTQYDDDGEVSATRDADGIWTNYAYDNDGELVSTFFAVGDADAATAGEAYDLDGELISETDALGNVTTYAYDRLGRVTSTTRGDGTSAASTTREQYDADGLVTDTWDALDRRTHYTYDDFGDVLTVTVGYGTSHEETTTFAYDDDGELLSETDPRGFVTAFDYDALGRRTAETVDSKSAHPITTHTEYNVVGEVTGVEDATGVWTRMTYDDFGEVATSAVGAEIITYDYDNLGDLTLVIDPMGEETDYSYDDFGDLLDTIDPLGNSWGETYDDDGNVLTSTDPLGHTTTYTYDDFGRQTSVTDPDGHLTATTYDLDGNVSSVTDADGNVTTFTYDAVGNRRTMTDPLGHSATYTYFADGQLATAVDRDGRSRVLTYDDLGQLHTETWLDASGQVVDVLSYTYDADGDLLTASNHAGTYTFTYDDEDRVATQTDLFGLTLTYTHDDDDRVTNVADSLAGSDASFYDDFGRLTRRTLSGPGFSALRVDFGYNDDDRVTSASRSVSGVASGPSTSYGYDDEGRLTGLSHSGGSGGAYESFVYGYDAADRLTSETDGAVTTVYGYDAAGQLTSDGAASHAYDAAGNRAGGGYQVGPGDRLLSDGAWTYTYDFEGNRVGKASLSTGETWAYGYDLANRLVTAVHRNAASQWLGSVAYTYDVFGNRVEEDDSGLSGPSGPTGEVSGGQTGEGGSSSPTVVVRRFAYDGDRVWADFSGSGALTSRYLDGGAVDELLARVDSNGAGAWYLTDRQGSVCDLVDGTGSVADRITYDAFGNITSETNAAVGGRYKYAGREYDAATGLYYNRARYYDPATGSWVEQDPAGFDAGDGNLYRYVGNSPTNATDPSGMAGEATMSQRGGRTAAAPRTVPREMDTYEFTQRIADDSARREQFDEMLHEATALYLKGERGTLPPTMTADPHTQFYRWRERQAQAIGYHLTHDKDGKLRSERELRNLNRGFAGLGLVGNATEAIGAVVLALTPEPTFATKAGAVGLGALAIDGGTANARTLLTGESANTLLSQGATSLAGTYYGPATAQRIGQNVDFAAHMAANINAAALRNGEASVGQGIVGDLAEGGAQAPGSLEGMAVYNRSQNFERHISEFFNDWKAEPILEDYIRRRMNQLGLRPNQIGIVDDVETGGAFSMEHLMGGRNSRPAWNPEVTKGGVNVDPGIFNPEFLADKAATWARSSLRDRIDAVIIHEVMEYNSRAASTGLRHRSAILRSPSTTADISPGARAILEEYRSWLLQRGNK